MRMLRTGTVSSSVAIRPLARPDPIPMQNPARTSATPQTAQLRLVSSPDVSEQQPLGLVFPSPNPFVPTIVEEVPSPRVAARPTSAWKSECADDEFFERQPTGRDELPEPRAWAQRYGQAWVEASVGRRSPKQLSRWSTPAVLSQLQSCTTTTPSPSPRSQQPRTIPARSAQVVVSRVRVDEPADGVAEVAAVVHSRGRSRALMLRLEGWDGRWVCTFAAML